MDLQIAKSLEATVSVTLGHKVDKSYVPEGSVASAVIYLVSEKGIPCTMSSRAKEFIPG